ncbi:hypothetical protein LD915_21255 [Salmonella enterica]|nr:hypothetical protein [Salmonella enterica]
MLIYNVFGRHIGVLRVQERWLVFRADLSESDIPAWLADIFHEAATERYPDVTRIE